MSFAIVTDTSANLPIEYARENDITIIPFSFYIDGEENTCTDAERFDGAAYYAMLREGKVVTTSQITPARYIEYLSPILEAGKDVLFICLSSGVSGAYSSSLIAARELARLYTERVVDAENQIIAISHADCKDEADALCELVCAEKPPKQVVMVCHEPATGSHVGPGMLAVYFLGNERIL